MALIATTPRLIIQTWELTDIDALCHLSALAGISDHSIRGYANYSREQAKLWIERELLRYRQSGLGKFAITLKETKAPIGLVGLFKMSPPDDESVEGMCRLPLKHRGHGYATEAARAIMSYGFDTLALKEIFVHRFMENQFTRPFISRLGNFQLNGTVSYEGVPAERWILRNPKS